MGSPSQILTGARAQLVVNGKVVGLFTSCSYNVTFDANPAFILGRYSAAEITYTAQEVVTVDANGFRVIGAAPSVVASIPQLQDLLNAEDISLSLLDRRTNVEFMTVTGVRPMGFSSNVSARGVVEISARFQGLIYSDESGQQQESAGASNLNSGT
jgi:hypothetical protein